MVGHPPFHDDNSSEEIFTQIKRYNDDLKWPRGDQVELGEFVKSTIKALLQKNAKKRPKYDGLKTSPWFSPINWEHIETRETEVAYKVVVKNATQAENISDEMKHEHHEFSVVPGFKLHQLLEMEKEFESILE